MLRVAALYDIHGNLPALRAVLAEVDAEGVDVIVVGGDVAFGPFTVGVLDVLLERPDVHWVRGNTDRLLVGSAHGQRAPLVNGVDYAPAFEWEALRLPDEHLSFLAALPDHQRFATCLGDTLFCHATPRSDEDILTEVSPEADWRDATRDVRADAIVCGHTHLPFERTVGRAWVLNAGSVGMPYGESAAHWLLLDDVARWRRASYDVLAAARRIRHSGHPFAELFAQSLLRPSNAPAARTHLEALAGRTTPTGTP